jgi:hypothetical protein
MALLDRVGGAPRALDLVARRRLGVLAVAARLPRQEVDQGAPGLGQRCMARCLGLAHHRRHQRDGGALAPFRTGDRIVVPGLDRDLHGQVHPSKEGVARRQHVVAALEGALAVEPRQHAPVFSVARAHHHVHLPQAVIVPRLVGQLQGLDLVELQRLGRTGQRDLGGLVDHGFDRNGLELVDQHLAEPGRDPKLTGLGDRPAGDHAPRPVAHERDLQLAVGEHQPAPVAARHPRAPRATCRPGVATRARDRRSARGA